LHDVIKAVEQPDRPILSQYHAAGAVSGAYMYKKGRWKLNYYVDFPPELFDLQNDPKEHFDLANDPEHADTLANLEAELRAILDPEAIDKFAFADQADLIEFHGGRDAALALGAPGATPLPKV
jgi:choline-sulfatase